MLRDILYFLLHILSSLFGIILLVRAWMFAIRLHPFNPYSQATHRLSDWLIVPLRRIVRPGNRMDWPSLLAAWLTALAFVLLSSVVLGGAPAVLSYPLQWLLVSVATLARWAFNLVFWLTLFQAVLSWINPMAPAMPVLTSLTAPLLDPIRRVLPRLGGLDLSPLVLLLLAQIANMVLQRAVFGFAAL